MAVSYQTTIELSKTYTLCNFDRETHCSPSGSRARPVPISQEEIVGHQVLHVRENVAVSVILDNT